MGEKMTKELLFTIIGILVIIILILVCYLHGYKKQLKLLAEQMQFIEDEETNIHGLEPTRLLHPWDFPGNSTGVGCH